LSQEGEDLMPSEEDNERVHRAGNGKVLRPAVWQRQDRHILVGVSHASDDPSRHRNFVVLATFDMVLGGWVARVAEQNTNDQRDAWGPHPIAPGEGRAFPSAATCLGDAVAAIIATADQDT
jgi:hypothetical protein